MRENEINQKHGGKINISQLITKIYLEGTKNAVTGCGLQKTNIEESTEWSLGVSWFNRVILSSGLKTIIISNSVQQAFNTLYVNTTYN